MAAKKIAAKPLSQEISPTNNAIIRQLLRGEGLNLSTAELAADYFDKHADASWWPPDVPLPAAVAKPRPLRARPRSADPPAKKGSPVRGRSNGKAVGSREQRYVVKPRAPNGRRATERRT